MDKMVSQERIADEIKIILKPYYCKGSINKDEYKNIMRNCVTKVGLTLSGDIEVICCDSYLLLLCA